MHDFFPFVFLLEVFAALWTLLYKEPDSPCRVFPSETRFGGKQLTLRRPRLQIICSAEAEQVNKSANHRTNKAHVDATNMMGTPWTVCTYCPHTLAFTSVTEL